MWKGKNKWKTSETVTFLDIDIVRLFYLKHHFHCALKKWVKDRKNKWIASLFQENLHSSFKKRCLIIRQKRRKRTAFPFRNPLGLPVGVCSRRIETSQLFISLSSCPAGRRQQGLQAAVRRCLQECSSRFLGRSRPDCRC